jgi:Ca2+-binding RTX toxin-like protein
MDRSAVPPGQSDADAEPEIGEWESSGIIDVSELFGEAPGSLMIFDVQAHTLTEGIIEEENLVQGGQLAFLVKEEDEPSFMPNFGSVDADEIEVSGSGKLVFAGGGDDLIDLSLAEGGNRVYGASGDDTFILGSGDYLTGDSGADIFYANGGGDNTLIGGDDADQFWIAVAEIPASPNTITDFTVGEDVISIAGLGIGFDDLSLTADSNNTLISAGGSDLATLLDVAFERLSADDFAFV